MEDSRELSAQVVNRVPLSQSSGNSGNAIERVTLADGQVLVHKRVSPEWDWLSRATGDNGRIVTMWERAERILSAVADMHGAFWDADIEGLCTIEERYQMLSLRTARAEKERGDPAGDPSSAHGTPSTNMRRRRWPALSPGCRLT